MTLLAEDPELWDSVFSESTARAHLVCQLAEQVGPRVLDVGCATGSLCELLRRRGLKPVGIDINRRFIAAARGKHPEGMYLVGEMKTFSLKRKFDVIVCLGSTFSYNLTNAAIGSCLANLRKHLAPGGRLVIDVLNAIAFSEPRPFAHRTRHYVHHLGKRMTATIRHELDLKRQLLTEQVTWQIAPRKVHVDRVEKLRLMFPQELAFHLEQAGFGEVKLTDTYGKSSAQFSGRRMIAIAARSLSSSQ